MKAIRYVVGFVLGAVVATSLYGCATPASGDDPNHGNNNPGMYRNTWHKMPDGRTVYCLYIEGHLGGYSSGNTPAFECDFDHAFVAKK